VPPDRIGFYMKEHGTPAAEPVMGRTEIRFKAEVAHALRQGSLPAWFKKQVGGCEWVRHSCFPRPKV
jgi:hypothetical protein